MPSTPKRTLIARAFVTALESIAAPTHNFTMDTVKIGTWVFDDTSALPGAEVFLGITSPDETRGREEVESSTTVSVVGWLNRAADVELEEELEKFLQDILNVILADETLGLADEGVWDVVPSSLEKDNLLDENLTGPCACLAEFEVKHQNDRLAF